MTALEWNPTFGPIATAIVLLGLGGLFYTLFRRIAARRGTRDAWLILSPKIVLAVLLCLALFDPVLKLSGWNSTPAKVVILRDISSSMDLRDDGSATRSERVAGIIDDLESSAPSHIQFVVLPFDTALHEAGYQPKLDVERGTDLAAALVAPADNKTLADAEGEILLTDGGDETIDLPKLPERPLAIVGIGASAEAWCDIGIGAVTAPATVEESSPFELQAEVYARQGTLARDPDALAAVKVTLEEWRDGKWAEAQNQTLNLSSLHAEADFHVQASGGTDLRYRVRLPELPGEVTYANNTRVVGVRVQKRALHVLYFTQEIGVDYKYLRNELASDPGMAFTAMYRMLEDNFTVQGERAGFQDLVRGFPTDEAVLRRYDCVILGSFPAGQLSDPQQKALIHFVETGGALVLLGGESSFGRGGYAESPLAALAPWVIRGDEPELTQGDFPVTVSPSGAAVAFTEGWRESLAQAGGVDLESVNEPGGLRPGSLSLLDALVNNRAEPVVAVQRYGKGQVLGIATNTMWKWAAAGEGPRGFYEKFWRQSLRGLTERLEGGSLLGIRWDRDHYRPGETARVEIRRQDSSSAGESRLVATLSGPGGQGGVTLDPVPGQSGFYSAKLTFVQRGDYTFRISAYAGAQVAETYERTLTVEPLVEEGANPELKDAYLQDIAAKAHGVYAGEKNLEPIKAFLRDQIRSHESITSIHLVDIWNVFPSAVLIILVAEWVVRRRLNLI